MVSAIPLTVMLLLIVMSRPVSTPSWIVRPGVAPSPKTASALETTSESLAIETLPDAISKSLPEPWYSNTTPAAVSVRPWTERFEEMVAYRFASDPSSSTRPGFVTEPETDPNVAAKLVSPALVEIVTVPCSIRKSPL